MQDLNAIEMWFVLCPSYPRFCFSLSLSHTHIHTHFSAQTLFWAHDVSERPITSFACLPRTFLQPSLSHTLIPTLKSSLKHTHTLSLSLSLSLSHTFSCTHRNTLTLSNTHTQSLLAGFLDAVSSV